MLHNFPLKQSINVIKAHSIISLVAFLFGILIFPAAITRPVGKIIFSVVATLMYALSIYSSAYECYNRDSKSYTDESPFMLKGLVIAVPLLIVTVIIYALYFLSWRFMSIEGVIVGASGWINNFLFLIWTFPFNGFLDLANGVMSWYGYVIIAVIPLISSTLGYLAGFYGFDLSGKINQLIYEKKNQEGKR